MLYKLFPNESPYDEPKGKESSVIILNADFEIIGETKFPGKKYFYKMSFVGGTVYIRKQSGKPGIRREQVGVYLP